MANRLSNLIKPLRGVDSGKESFKKIAIKNASYDLSTSIFSKIGSMIFTIIIARILLPEMFGLYSLALSTLLLFNGLSDFGISSASVRFISQSLGQNKKSKAKAYATYLTKIKIIPLFLASLLLLVLAKFIANDYYQKPIYLALVAGSLYVLFISLTSFLQSFFQAANNFKVLFIREVSFQMMRLILVPLFIIYALKHLVSEEISLALIILALSITWLFMIVLLILSFSKLDYFKSKTEVLTKIEKQETKKFIFGIILFSLATLFFGYIDVILLGRFISSEFIGYYQAAIGFIGALSFVLVFSNSLFPIFSRISGERLKQALNRSIKPILLISSLLFVFSILFAPWVFQLAYGKEYAVSFWLIRIFSLLLISTPLVALYSTYFISQGKLKSLTKFLIIANCFGFMLDYAFIKIGLGFGELGAILGLATATVLGKFFYLLLMTLSKK